ATDNLGSRGSVTLNTVGNEGMEPRFGSQSYSQGPDPIWRRSKRSWFLIGLRVFREEREHQRRIDVWVDGSFHGTYFDDTSSTGAPSVLRQVTHTIRRGIGFSQIGVYEGARDPEWHLEQARRCGVAPW